MNFEAEQRLIVLAFALLIAAFYGLVGNRGQRLMVIREQRLVVMPVALLVALLLYFNILSAVVAYGLLCLAMVSVYVVREERARQARVASLVPRPAVEVVPAIWIVGALASAFLAIPYVTIAQQRVSATLVAVCAIAMALIAWRSATAPVQLAGRNLASEQNADRANRMLRTGVTCVLAAGNVFVFTSFVTPGLAEEIQPLYRHLQLGSWILWMALFAWVGWYSYRLGCFSRGASCE